MDSLGGRGPETPDVPRRRFRGFPASGEYEVRCFARVETRFDVGASIVRLARLRAAVSVSVGRVETGNVTE
jgi:hypothetical protein